MTASTPNPKKSTVQSALAQGREMSKVVSRYLEKLPLKRGGDTHPNSRQLAQGIGTTDSEEARRSRAEARAFIAQAEAGEVADTTEYARKKIEELRSRV